MRLVALARDAASTNRGDLFYRERPRCPFWVYLGFFLVPAACYGVVLAFLFLVGVHGSFWWGGGGGLVGSVVCGALPAVSQRLVVVDRSGVRVGRMSIPASSIARTQPLAGSALKIARHEIARVDDVWPGLRLGPLSSGLGMVASGISLIQSEDRRRGMLCSPWQEPALLVETPMLPTKRWLISAREPQKLEEAIRRALASTTRRE
jgi:Protein of unknown function (DUF3093)